MFLVEIKAKWQDASTKKRERAWYTTHRRIEEGVAQLPGRLGRLETGNVITNLYLRPRRIAGTVSEGRVVVSSRYKRGEEFIPLGDNDKIMIHPHHKTQRVFLEGRRRRVILDELTIARTSDALLPTGQKIKS